MAENLHARDSRDIFALHLPKYVRQSHREAETILLEQGHVVDDGHLLGSRSLERQRPASENAARSSVELRPFSSRTHSKSFTVSAFNELQGFEPLDYRKNFLP